MIPIGLARQWFWYAYQCNAGCCSITEQEYLEDQSIKWCWKLFSDGWHISYD